MIQISINYFKIVTIGIYMCNSLIRYSILSFSHCSCITLVKRYRVGTSINRLEFILLCLLRKSAWPAVHWWPSKDALGREIV
jgi:hypothetical protein